MVYENESDLPTGTSADESYLESSLRAQEDALKRANAELDIETARVVADAERAVERIETANVTVAGDEPSTSTGDLPLDYGFDVAINSRATSASHSHERRRAKSASSSKASRRVELRDDVADSGGGDASTSASSMLLGGLDPEDEGLNHPALIRMLKAKLRVTEQERDALASVHTNKDDREHALQMEVKGLTMDLERQRKATAHLQSIADKQKKKLADTQKKAVDAEAELTALRKELNVEGKNRRSHTTEQQNLTVRLNRALEDVDKYKAALGKQKQDANEAAETMKKHVNALIADKKVLERQKTELMGAFQKQLKLIDILRRQKAHVEAAKVLQFSEQEFLRAMEI